MDELKQYKKSETWFNRQTGVTEIIENMNAKKASYKLKLVTTKVNSHKSQIESLMAIRRNLLKRLVETCKRATKVKDLDLSNEIIFLNGDDLQPIVVEKAALQANGIKLSEMIKAKRIYVLEQTRKSDNL